MLTLEVIISYLIIIMPSIVTIIGSIAAIVSAINKVRKSSAEHKQAMAEANALVETAKATVIEIQSSPQLKQILDTYKKEHTELTKTITQLSEQLAHIHRLHPEWIDENKDGE